MNHTDYQLFSLGKKSCQIQYDVSVLGHCRQNTDLTPPLYRERSGKAFLTFPSKFVLDKDWCYHCAEAIQKRSSLSQKRCPKKGMLRAF